MIDQEGEMVKYKFNFVNGQLWLNQNKDFIGRIRETNRYLEILNILEDPTAIRNYLDCCLIVKKT